MLIKKHKEKMQYTYQREEQLIRNAHIVKYHHYIKKVVCAYRFIVILIHKAWIEAKIIQIMFGLK